MIIKTAIETSAINKLNLLSSLACSLQKKEYKGLKFLINTSRTNKYSSTREKSKDSATYFTIPFVRSISDCFKNITRDLNDFHISVSTNCIVLLKYIRTIFQNLQSAMLYNKINCDDCDAFYVGQTSRRLLTRINEHRNHIRRSTSNYFVITDYRVNFNHKFKWDYVKVLDNEPFLNKRLISEMLFIKRQENSLNLQTDPEGLHQLYHRNK